MIRAVLLCLAAVLAVQDLSGPVVRVSDGDTIEVDLGGDVERVRYIGIDTPEMSDPRAPVRELALEARRANARLVAGRTVRLELDVEKRDRYGRLLAYVYVGDILVNEALVRSGHAAPSTFPPNVRYVERFVEAARQARQTRQAREEAAPGDAPAGGQVAVAAGGEAGVGGPGPGHPPGPGDPPGSIPALAASAHVGETKTVCGRVASTRYLERGRRPTFLNLGRPYPAQDVTVIIWGEDRERFGTPEDTYRSEQICVTGRIQTYRGTPQIIVRRPETLWIVPSE